MVIEYVYVIKNTSGKIYIGYTKDLRQRLKQHNLGMNKATKGQKWELIYYEAYKSSQDARKREKSLKNSGQAIRWLKDRIKESLLG